VRRTYQSCLIVAQSLPSALRNGSGIYYCTAHRAKTECAAAPFAASSEFRKNIPEMFLTCEPQPVSAHCNNPLLDEHGAAVFLGLSRELLKKWSQRGFGPDYIQYGKNGPIRYEVNELTEFRLFHRIQLRSAQ